MKNRECNPTRAESVAERPYSPTLNKIYGGVKQFVTEEDGAKPIENMTRSSIGAALNRTYASTIKPVESAVREEAYRLKDPKVRTKFLEIVGTAAATFGILSCGRFWQ